MKETGIIMSGDHPRKILDGSKTMTRRVIKDPRRRKHGFMSIARYGEGRPSVGDLQREIELTKDIPPNFPCPYGQVGDRLWVRETFAKRADGVDQILFKAQYEELTKMFNSTDRPDWLPRLRPWPTIKWQPSIHMFRKDSRITLEITEVRVERLQEITEKDAEAEGLVSHIDSFQPGCSYMVEAKEKFERLWDSINGKKYPWESNPWVWVIGWSKFSFENTS